MAEWERMAEEATRRMESHHWRRWYVNVVNRFSVVQAKPVTINWDKVQHTLGTLPPRGLR